LPVSATAGATVTVRPLDGGEVIGGISVTNGSASIAFQAGSQPGLYRVVVDGDGTTATLQFWVVNPLNARANPPVLNPTH
jgi:hypothetical protein